MTYRKDNTGHLRRHRDRGWMLQIPAKEFKNVANEEIFGKGQTLKDVQIYLEEDDSYEELLPLLEDYIENYHSTFDQSKDYLFPSLGKRPLDMYDVVSKWVERFLTAEGIGLRLDGVFSFGPHAFRHIVATHIIKTTGSIDLAANILLDSREVVALSYARFMPSDRLALASRALAKSRQEFKVRAV